MCKVNAFIIIFFFNFMFIIITCLIAFIVSITVYVETALYIKRHFDHIHLLIHHHHLQLMFFSINLFSILILFFIILFI